MSWVGDKYKELLFVVILALFSHVFIHQISHDLGVVQVNLDCYSCSSDVIVSSTTIDYIAPLHSQLLLTIKVVNFTQSFLHYNPRSPPSVDIKSTYINKLGLLWTSKYY